MKKAERRFIQDRPGETIYSDEHRVCYEGRCYHIREYFSRRNSKGKSPSYEASTRRKCYTRPTANRQMKELPAADSVVDRRVRPCGRGCPCAEWATYQDPKTYMPYRPKEGRDDDITG